jgi:hypothetical protein
MAKVTAWTTERVTKSGGPGTGATGKFHFGVLVMVDNGGHAKTPVTKDMQSVTCRPGYQGAVNSNSRSNEEATNKNGEENATYESMYLRRTTTVTVLSPFGDDSHPRSMLHGLHVMAPNDVVPRETNRYTKASLYPKKLLA